MDDDRLELARRLFAQAAAPIETAYDAAIVGQAPGLGPEEYAEAARRLENAARDIAALAGAVIVATRPSLDDGGTKSEQNPL